MKISRTRWIVLASLVVWMVPAGGGLYAQQPILRFKHLTHDHGLSDNTVEAIVEDHRGFMWFGTYDGLNRFDGYTFEVYRYDINDPTSLSQNQVATLVEDTEGILWVGTGNGLNRYDRATDTFDRYLHDPQDDATLSNGLIYSLFEDHAGTLWVGTYAGLNRYDRETDTFVRYLAGEHDPANGLRNGIVRSIAEDREGMLWIATDGGGLHRFDPRTETFTSYRHDPSDPHSLSHDNAWVVYVDHDNTVWAGTNEGLNRFDRATGTFRRYYHEADDPHSLGSDHVVTLFEDSQGHFWVGTDGAGLNLLDRATDTFTHYRPNVANETSLASHNILSIFEDSKNDLWVGTFTGGLHFFNTGSAAFTTYHHETDNPRSLSHNAVLCFFEDEDGSLWIGTEGGLNHLDRETGLFRRYLHDERDPTSLSANAVLSVFRDSRGRLWVGTFFGGLNRLNEEDGTFVHFQPDASDPNSINNPHVWDILEDRRGHLWFATFNGVSRLDEATGAFTPYLNESNDSTSIGHNTVWNLYEDAEGTMWVGTEDGLSRYDPAQDVFYTYRHEDADPTSLSEDQVYTVLQDSKGRLWVGTTGGGLNLFDRSSGTFTAYRTAHGLPNDVIFGILEDEQGFLWISTNDGLAKFDPETELFTAYDKSDGLLAEPFTRKAYLKSRTGELFFGGLNGFVSFDPLRVRDNPHVPPVVLTDFQVFNKPVPIGGDRSPLQQHITEAKQIRLRYDQSVISFMYAALNFRAPEKNRYQYILEGFDQDWTQAGARRMATYTNLDPGTYTFRVKGSNNTGLWNQNGAAIELVIAPPYWATWWFRALSLVAIVAMVLVVHRVRTRTMRDHNNALQAEITERRRIEALLETKNEELTARNDELEMRNSEMERFTYTVSHDLKTPLVTIKGFIGMLRQDAEVGDWERMRIDIDHISRAADTMSRLLNELLELSRIGRIINPPEVIALNDLVTEALESVHEQIRRRGVTLTIPPTMPAVYGDRIRLLEVYQNLFDNAIKFMGDQPEPHIEVGADHKGSHVVCFVKDNGIGIEESYHEKVFGLFERLDQRVEGTGVGLALVKRIVEVHEGKIWIASDGRGKGSTFWFNLPVVEVESRRDGTRTDEVYT